MKKYLLLLLSLFIGLSSFSQTSPSLPSGAKPYGNQLYIVTATGDIWGGNAGYGYRVIAKKSYVDSLINLRYKKTQVDSLLALKANLSYVNTEIGNTVDYINTGLALKQNNLGFTPENVANKVTSLTSPNSTTYPTSGILYDAISNKVQRTAISYTGKNIVFFGDSYTSGSGASTSNLRWTSLLANSLKAVEVNNGVAGTTLENRVPINYMNGPNMTQNIAAIPTKTSSYALLVFAYGLNDMGQTAAAYTTANYITDYTTVMNAALAKGWQPSQILLIPPYFIGSVGYGAYAGITGNAAPTRARHLSFVDATKTVSQTFGSLYVDIFRDQLKNDTTLISDGIHPNDAGYAYIASDVLQYLTGEQLGNNQIFFDDYGIAAPTSLPTRSSGTKAVWYQGSGTSADFATGIEATRLWHSVPTSAYGFSWYTNTAKLMDLTLAGGLVINSTITPSISAGSAKTYFLTSNGSDVITGRTASQVLSDIGAMSSGAISGTTNTLTKFTSSTGIGNSSITDNGTLVNSSIPIQATKLGLGISATQADLQMNVGSVLDNSRGNLFIGSNTAFAANVGGMLGFGAVYNAGGSQTNLAGISGRKESATDGDFAGYLAFMTRPSGSTQVEGMRLNSFQHLIIGGTADDNNGAKLQIQGRASGTTQPVNANDFVRVTDRLFVSSTTTALTSASLNSSFANVLVGFRVICPSIVGAPVIYTKATENGTSDVWLTTAATITP